MLPLCTAGRHFQAMVRGKNRNQEHLQWSCRWALVDQWTSNLQLNVKRRDIIIVAKEYGVKNYGVKRFFKR